ncbi:hypothetical protein SHIRM173S_12629 [Streptomyces hirsutus]
MTTTSTDHRIAPDAAGSGGLRLDGVTLTLGDGDSAVTALDHVGLGVAPASSSPSSAPRDPASPASSPSPAAFSSPPRAPCTSPEPS